jgi:hypothetical protein
MLFMIIERFKNGDPVPVYQRFRERGRLAPEGLYYVSSWVDATLTTCYQVMETSDAVLIGVPDIEPLFEDYRRKGARIRQPPTNFRWAYEMQIEDLDGHVLRIGSDSKEGQPFGPWLDMHGRYWGPAAEGGWKRSER